MVTPSKVITIQSMPVARTIKTTLPMSSLRSLIGKAYPRLVTKVLLWRDICVKSALKWPMIHTILKLTQPNSCATFLTNHHNTMQFRSIFWFTLTMKKKHDEDDDDLRRINVKLDQDEYERFKTLADDESRSMTNFASLLIRRYIREAWAKRLSAESKPDTPPDKR